MAKPCFAQDDKIGRLYDKLQFESQFTKKGTVLWAGPDIVFVSRRILL